MMDSSNSSWSYDVFLSFRGEDTRKSFMGHLYEALVRAGINVFRDTEELKRGMQISQELCEAINGSRFFVVVFSKNYASSSWCLDEVVQIMSCMEGGKGQMVWPLFYHIDPSEVRKQTGLFGEAFIVHKERFKEDLKKVERWREALTKAANLSSWHLYDSSCDEATLVKEIVHEISTKLNKTLLTIAKNPVGIGSHIEKLNSALDLESNDVRMIGIYGLGGIGKTTVAKAVYNCIAYRFEGCSFLPNIKEKCNFSRDDELTKLQESLLQDILLIKMHRSISFSDEGSNVLRHRLRNKKVLIVLDDVDHSDQLEKLAGHLSWFGSGSRIMITTRDFHLLNKLNIKWTYKVDKLNHREALELFCWNAFNNPVPDVSFEELSNVAVEHANGLPLALAVVGGSLCNCSKLEWESQLKKLKKIPNQDVHNKLKLSFDKLGDLQKTIFLDIACFFRGYPTEDVYSFLDACDFYPRSEIEVLIKKCLIYIEYNRFQMHDLIQLMGKEIVRQESPSDVGRRSRLWYHQDVLQVLQEDEATEKVEGIVLELPKAEEVVWLDAKSFSKMTKLRLLIIRNNVNVIGTPRCFSNYLRWFECHRSSSSLVPYTFNPKNLVVLVISHYPIMHLVANLKCFESIRQLSLENCEMLTEIGDISLMPNLIKLEIINCFNLECFSSTGLKSKTLQCLHLKSCYKLKKFPDIVEEMECLQILSLEEIGVTELPKSIEKLSGLRHLELSLCEDLLQLPSIIYDLKMLNSLKLSKCLKLQEFPQPSNSSTNVKKFLPLRLLNQKNLLSTSVTYMIYFNLNYICK
uniref:TIR domain-containing protein n=1 Tax=Cucumis melo TaxID=3656 RepID=A0A1S4E327_CUCME